MDINNKYRIVSDDLNVILQEIYQKKDKDGNDKGEGIKVIGYYPNIKLALKDMCKKEIHGTGLDSFKLVVNKIDNLYKLIEDIKAGMEAREDIEEEDIEEEDIEED